MARAETRPPADIPQPALRVDQGKARDCLRRLNIHKQAPVLALAPGAAYGPSKQWPPDFFAAVAKRYIKQGWSVWIFGAQSDRPVADKIAADCGDDQHVLNLCARTRLEETVDLLAETRLLLSNDSGLMHIGAAVGVPVVSIYGSTSPDYMPPLTSDKAVLYHRIACSPCWQKTCRYGHYDCLRKITPDEAIKACERLVKEPSHGWRGLK